MDDEPIKIRFATKEDMIDLIIIGQEYFAKSIWSSSLRPDWSLYAHTLNKLIEDDLLLVAEDQGTLAGFLAMSLSYWLFASGDLSEEIFYVRPKYKGSGATRGLRAAFIEIKKKFKPALSMGGSTSGMGDRNEKMYTNMLKKEGYIPLGPACIQFNPDCAEAI